MAERRGKFIVIEGADGAGKGTQVQLLTTRFQELDIPHQVVDFPRYEDNTYGRLVGRYLKGEFGGLEGVSPYLASLTYAGDRMLAKDDINTWLAEGKIVLANRYVLSSKAYMSARLPVDKRQDFLSWLDELEYQTHGIPREDLVIFLYLPPEIGQRNVDKKKDRKHLDGKKRDIMESNLHYQKEVAGIYLEFAKDDPKWELIDCLSNGAMKSREDIHQEIVGVLRERGIIQV